MQCGLRHDIFSGNQGPMCLTFGLRCLHFLKFINQLLWTAFFLVWHFWTMFPFPHRRLTRADELKGEFTYRISIIYLHLRQRLHHFASNGCNFWSKKTQHAMFRWVCRFEQGIPYDLKRNLEITSLMKVVRFDFEQVCQLAYQVVDPAAKPLLVCCAEEPIVSTSHLSLCRRTGAYSLQLLT